MKNLLILITLIVTVLWLFFALKTHTSIREVYVCKGKYQEKTTVQFSPNANPDTCGWVSVSMSENLFVTKIYVY